MEYGYDNFNYFYGSDFVLSYIVNLKNYIDNKFNELGTKYGTSLDFDVVKHNLSLLNSQDEKIGGSVNINAGIDDLTLEVDDYEEEIYTMNFYDGNGTLIDSTPPTSYCGCGW